MVISQIKRTKRPKFGFKIIDVYLQAVSESSLSHTLYSRIDEQILYVDIVIYVYLR